MKVGDLVRYKSRNDKMGIITKINYSVVGHPNSGIDLATVLWAQTDHTTVEFTTELVVIEKKI